MYKLTNYENNLKDYGPCIAVNFNEYIDVDLIKEKIESCHKKYPDLNSKYILKEDGYYLKNSEGIKIDVKEEDYKIEYFEKEVKKGAGDDVIRYIYYFSKENNRCTLILVVSHTILNLKSCFNVLSYIVNELSGKEVDRSVRKWISIEKNVERQEPKNVFNEVCPKGTLVFPTYFEEVEDLRKSSNKSYHNYIETSKFNKILLELKRNESRPQSLLWISLLLSYLKINGKKELENKSILFEVPVDYLGKIEFKSEIAKDSLVGAVGLLYVPVMIDIRENIKDVVRKVSDTLSKELDSKRQLKETIAIFTPSELIELPDPTILASNMGKIDMETRKIVDINLISTYVANKDIRNYTFHAYALENIGYFVNVSYLEPGYKTETMERWVNSCIEIMCDYLNNKTVEEILR